MSGPARKQLALSADWRTLWVVQLVVAFILLVCSMERIKAEEQHSVGTALSQTTLSGYVDTSFIWQSFPCPFAGPVWKPGTWITVKDACVAEVWQQGPILTVNAKGGQRFRVETTDSFGPTVTWTTLGEITMPEDAETIHIVDAASEPKSARFYRCSNLSEPLVAEAAEAVAPP